MGKKHPKTTEEVTIEQIIPEEITLEERKKEVDISTLTERDLAEGMYLMIQEIFDLAKSGHIPSVGTKAGKTKKDKDERKAELLASVPYEKETLKGLMRKELAMLASALELPKEKSFGQATNDLIANILEAQDAR